MTFINGFAANDPDSYLRVWRRLDLDQDPGEVFILMNIRSDRQRRSKDLAPLLGSQMHASRYILIGAETALFADMLSRGGVSRQNISDLSGLPAEELWNRICALADGDCSVFGMGNIAGIGNQLLDLLRGQRLTS